MKSPVEAGAAGTTAGAETASTPRTPSIVIVGAGPAGLMAAQACVDEGAQVTVFDAMPSVGRKFLLAGKGGLNITHSEPADAFLRRYGSRQAHLQPMLDAFGPVQLRDWVQSLGIDTFVGTSGRVFPREMKAAPMLRAWLRRLRDAGVDFHSRSRWTGSLVDDDPARIGGLGITLAQQETLLDVKADAIILALGGGSWPRLGSDGAWVPSLARHGVAVAPLAPANCGFDCGWSQHFSQRWAGTPVKSAAIAFADSPDASGVEATPLRGEFVVTRTGVEGSLVYRFSAAAREHIAAAGSATLHLDLLPDRSDAWVRQRLRQPRGSLSLANHLRRNLGLAGIKAALLRECMADLNGTATEDVAAAIKRLPVRLLAPRPLAEAISTAGGVRFDSLDERLLCCARPGIFGAGEMLDWDAPTGGYRLTACFATGRAAGLGAIHWLRSRTSEPSTA